MTAATVAAALGALSILPLWAAPPAVAQGGAALLHMVALVLAAVRLLRYAAPGDARERRSRLFLAASMGVVAAAALTSLGYVGFQGSVPVPSLVDPIALLWVPLAAYGLWLVPSHDGNPVPTRRLLADGAVAGSALLLSSWMLVLEPIAGAPRSSVLGQAVVLAYPLTDVLMATLVLLVLPRARADQRDFLNVAALGLVLVAVADSGSAVRFADSGVVSFGWPDAVLQAGLALIAFGAGMRRLPALARRTTTTGAERVIPLFSPLVAGGAAVVFVARGGTIGLGITLLGVVVLGALVVRQLVFVRELTVVAEGFRQAAVHDALTGLPNRKAFIAQLDEETRLPFAGRAAVVILDLDGFKGVNDTLGHDAGDRVLVDFAAVLSSAAGSHFAARLGGDEFALLVVAESPERDARRIADGVARSAMPHGGGMTVTCSVGISVLRPGDTAATALRRADLAMFWVKRTTQVQVAVFDEGMAERAARRNLLVAQLPGAAGRGELRLVYQPLFRAEDERLVGAEALLRWRHPVLGDVPPDEFVPLAEESGEIRAIGAWVIDTALAQTAAWRRRGRLLPQVLVNVAAAQFTDELAYEVGAGLARHGVSPHCLVVEITESQLPGLAANRAVQRLRESGVRVAMDDFGSGYSSLAQLARLPVDILKIDRDVILALEEGSGRLVLDTVVLLADALGLETIAEGVEVPEQAAHVRAAGIDYVQGFLLSRPLEPEALFERLIAPCVVDPRTEASVGPLRGVPAGDRA